MYSITKTYKSTFKLFTTLILSNFSSKKCFDFNNKANLKQRLSRLEYQVTQNNATQPPFRNQYYNNHKKGIYACIVCDQILFTSENKYDSGSGWPAFYDLYKSAQIIKIVDSSHGMIRTEIKCKKCNSHLGHLFEDGPKQKTGLRYCINSASLNFKEEL